MAEEAPSGWPRLAWRWALAVAARLVLVALGTGEALLWQPEVTTPANSLLKAREGLRLLQLGLSPYQGASCHVPPLWLAIAARWVAHPVLYVLPNTACDLVGGAAVAAAAAALFRGRGEGQGRPGGEQRDAPWMSPGQLSLLYLFNPFAVAACVAGTTASAENAAVALALAGGAGRNPVLAGFGVAAGAYLGLQPLLLLLPLAMMVWRGPEDVLQRVPPPKQLGGAPQAEEAGGAAAGGDGDGDSGNALPQLDAAAPGGAELRRRRGAGEAAAGADAAAAAAAADNPDASEQPRQMASATASAARGAVGPVRPGACCLFVACALLCGAALALLSDAALRGHPSAQCLPALAAWARASLPGGGGGRPLARQAAARALAGCWAGRVYGLQLLLRDYTPTIGMWWYFFTEMFDAFRPFFLFVFHSHAALLAAPLALRFPRRPLLVALALLLVGCMMRPYPSVGDMVPWMTLLPLLQQQLQCVRMGLFFANALLLLAVLGPAMWHQWIAVDAANSNFFYSVTLLLGVWYTVLLVQLLRYTAELDRRLAGKHAVAAAAAGEAAGEARRHEKAA